MPKTDKRLDQKSQETIRIKAIKMLNKGNALKDVADVFEVSRKAVENWRKKYLNGGYEALKAQKRGCPKGIRTRLTEEQALHVQKLIIDKCPDQLKMPFVLWTRKAVQELIKTELKVELGIHAVGNYLKAWGFTPQRPLKKAYEQNDAKVKKWLEEEYIELKKRVKAENGEIHWGDETGMTSHCHVERGYSPAGQTPVAEKMAKKFSINMISSVTNQGKVRFMIYEDKMNADKFITFMKRLIKDSCGKKVFFIVDNLRVHHAKIVKEWLNKTDVKDRIELIYLPSYSPELNPDEYLNCDVKRNANSKRIPKNKSELKSNLRGHMRLLQNRPERVKSYFNHEKIKYAASG